MGLRGNPAAPSRNDNPYDDSAFCWSLVEEAISTRVVGDFCDQNRDFQVDALFEALLSAGHPRRRQTCVDIIRDLFPKRIPLNCVWSNEEYAIATDVLAKKGLHCSTSELAIALSCEISTSCGTQRSIDSYKRYVSRLKKSATHEWKGRELAIFNLVEMEHHDKSASELGLLLSHRLLRELNIERAPSTCTTKIQETRRRRQETGGMGGENDTAEATMNESPATFIASATTLSALPAVAGSLNRAKSNSDYEHKGRDGAGGNGQRFTHDIVRNASSEDLTFEGHDATAATTLPDQPDFQDIDNWHAQKRQRADSVTEEDPAKKPRFRAEPGKSYFRVPGDDPRQRRHCTAAELKDIINDSFAVRPESLLREQAYYRHITAPRYFTFRGQMKVTETGKEVLRL
jgi:hypothetical protein